MPTAITAIWLSSAIQSYAGIHVPAGACIRQQSVHESNVHESNDATLDWALTLNVVLWVNYDCYLMRFYKIV